MFKAIVDLLTECVYHPILEFTPFALDSPLFDIALTVCQ